MNYLQKVEQSLVPLKDGVVDLVKSIISVNRAIDAKCYLFGKNQITQLLVNIIKVDGIIDDYAVEKIWQDKPLVKLEDIAHESVVINCVSCNKPRTSEERVIKAGISKFLKYSDLYQCYSEIIPLYFVFEETRVDLVRNSSKWEWIESRLFDEESKITLKNILKFRISGDYNYISNYNFRPWDQYFENLDKDNAEIFVDCGGYDGDTTEEFCKRYPNYEKIYIFEPSVSNINRARQRLKKYRDIEFIQMGVSFKEETLRFNSSVGSASCISETGSSEIEATTLDKKIISRITFIKMDLEGWELKALQGTVRHIQESHPKLAIAVYHNPSDFWRIPEFILSIRDDYRIYLRHYTEGWSETVMYFIPCK